MLPSQVDHYRLTLHSDMWQMERMERFAVPEFEIEFMQAMTDHHETAMWEAEKCLDRAAHPDLVQLCGTDRRITDGGDRPDAGAAL